MTTTFTLEYWRDDDWYVGQMREVPGVGEYPRSLPADAEGAPDDPPPAPDPT